MMASSGRLKSEAMAGFFLRPPSPRLSSNWSFLRSAQSRWETRLARLELTKVRHSGKCRRVATPRRYHHHPSLNYTSSIDQDKQVMLLDRMAVSILCSVVFTYIRFKRRSMVLPILKMHLFSLPSIKHARMHRNAIPMLIKTERSYNASQAAMVPQTPSYTNHSILLFVHVNPPLVLLHPRLAHLLLGQIESRKSLCLSRAPGW